MAGRRVLFAWCLINIAIAVEATEGRQFQGRWCSNPCGSTSRPWNLPCEFVIADDHIKWKFEWRTFVRQYHVLDGKQDEETLLLKGGVSDWYDHEALSDSKFKIILSRNHDNAMVGNAVKLSDFRYDKTTDSWRPLGSWFITRCERVANPYDPQEDYGPYEPESDLTPNGALVGDAYAAALRASDSAAQRGR